MSSSKQPKKTISGQKIATFNLNNGRFEFWLTTNGCRIVMLLDGQSYVFDFNRDATMFLAEGCLAIVDLIDKQHSQGKRKSMVEHFMDLNFNGDYENE